MSSAWAIGASCGYCHHSRHSGTILGVQPPAVAGLLVCRLRIAMCQHHLCQKRRSGVTTPAAPVQQS